jgi:hypothetical protein
MESHPPSGSVHLDCRRASYTCGSILSNRPAAGQALCSEGPSTQPTAAKRHIFGHNYGVKLIRRPEGGMNPGIVPQRKLPGGRWERTNTLKFPPCLTGLYLGISDATLHATHLICKTFCHPKNLHAAMPFFMKAITPRLPDPSGLNTQAARSVSNRSSHMYGIMGESDALRQQYDGTFVS